MLMFWSLCGCLAAIGAISLIKSIRAEKRAEAKIRDWLLLLGYNVLRYTGGSPRSNMLGIILMRPDHCYCPCGKFTAELSEVMPANGPGLARVVQLGHVCPYCGRISVRDQVKKSSLGSRMEDGTNFFDLVEVMSHGEAAKTGPLLSDDKAPVAVPTRIAS